MINNEIAFSYNAVLLRFLRPSPCQLASVECCVLCVDVSKNSKWETTKHKTHAALRFVVCFDDWRAQFVFLFFIGAKADGFCSGGRVLLPEGGGRIGHLPAK